MQQNRGLILLRTTLIRKNPKKKNTLYQPGRKFNPKLAFLNPPFCQGMA